MGEDVTEKPHKERFAERRQLWGRAQGRPLSARQAELVESLLPKLAATPHPLEGFENKQGITLEIGFGGGEHLLYRAQEQSDMGFIGAEPFLNGVAKALTGIADAGLSNVKLHLGDVRAVLDELPDNCLDCVYILYPDPWPKPRHYKRRLIQDEFISEIYRVLKTGGELRFASDIISYVDWALARILRFKAKDGSVFQWSAEDAQAWLQPYEGWPSTRYEAKAFREGRAPHYFTFIKA